MLMQFGTEIQGRKLFDFEILISADFFIPKMQILR